MIADVVGLLPIQCHIVGLALATVFCLTDRDPGNVSGKYINAS